MDIYESEHEQVEAIKKWWKENGKTLIAGLVLGLGAVFAWTSWQSYTTARAEQASALYEQVLNLSNAKQFDRATVTGQALIAEYSGSAYAPLAALVLANDAYRQNKSAEAKGHLRWVLDNDAPADLKLLAQLRLAQLMLEEGNFDGALALLDQAAPDKNFQPLFDETRGDVLVAQGKADQARTLYEGALEEMRSAANRARLQLKLDDLGHLNLPMEATSAQAGR